MAIQESIYTVHPDVVTEAIKILAGAVVLLGGSLVSVLLYIWHSHKKDWGDAVSSLESKIEKISASIEKVAEELFGKTNHLDHRLTEIETVCRERKIICPHIAVLESHSHHRAEDTKP